MPNLSDLSRLDRRWGILQISNLQINYGVIEFLVLSTSLSSLVLR